MLQRRPHRCRVDAILLEKFNAAKEFKGKSQWLQGSWSGIIGHSKHAHKRVTGVPIDKIQQVGEVLLINTPAGEYSEYPKYWRSANAAPT